MYKSKTYSEDLKQVLDEMNKQGLSLSSLFNKSILITGASGLICSAVVDLLVMNNKLNNGGTKLYLAGRNETKTRERFLLETDTDELCFVQYDASKSNYFDFYVDYIIHGASNAFPEVIQKYPVETMLNNFSAVHELLKYLYDAKGERLLYISSSEVYGRREKEEPFKEDEYGFVDILNPRMSYACAKRAAETMCISYGVEYGIDTVIVRPGHIYGPTASKRDNRVSSAFAYKALAGEDLVLKSEGKQIRSYCYVLDAASAILTVLLKGKSGNAYNISNPNSVMSISDITRLYAKYGYVQIKFDIPTPSETAAFNPMDNSNLNSEKLESLGWRGIFNRETGVEHTLKTLRETIED